MSDFGRKLARKAKAAAKANRLNPEAARTANAAKAAREASANAARMRNLAKAHCDEHHPGNGFNANMMMVVYKLHLKNRKDALTHDMLSKAMTVPLCECGNRKTCMCVHEAKKAAADEAGLCTRV